MRRALVVLLPIALVACTRTISVVDPPKDVPEPGTTPLDPVMSFEPDLEPPAEETDVPDPTVEEPPVDDIPVARSPIYAHSSDTLYEVDPISGLATEIANFTLGATALEGIVDLAIDMQGRMYGGDRGERQGGPYNLYRIDPLTAEATWVCTTDQEMTALTFTSDGDLIAGGLDGLVTMDLTRNCRTTVLVQDDSLVTSGDVVGLPDGLVYWTVRGNDGDELFAVNPRTGSVTSKGDIRFDRLYGLAFDADEDKLYGFSSDGETVEIAWSNARSSLLDQTDGVAWWGATTNPVVWGP
jgi:hypothetical protein